MKAEFGRQGTRRYVVCPAERGQEVVYRSLVRNVDRREPGTPLKTVAVEKVVVPDGHVKQAAWSHARRIVVVILSPRSRYLQECGSVLRCRTEGVGTDRRSRRCVN